jgi:putative hydrolase of the HAD superfamily
MLTDLIFDFFGTLVQYQADRFHGAPYRRTYQQLGELGIAIAYDDFAAGFAATFDRLEAEARISHQEFHMREVGRRFFADLGVSLAPEALDRWVDCYCEEWNRGTLYFDGIAAFIAELAGRYRLSIISNTHYPALIHRNLAAMGIAGHFAQVVTSVEVGIRKPHPAIFGQALRALGLDAGAALYVGDSYGDDYQGAHAAGLECVLIDPPGQYRGEVERRIGHLFELDPRAER